MTATGSPERRPLTQYDLAAGALATTLVLGTISDLLFAATFRFRFDWFADPARLVAAGHLKATRRS
ncbi:MAG: hypothetical protein ACR2KI_04855 [Candidatus Limnocylindria bacterium]